IGTLAKRAEQEGFTTYMMTSDKDYGQLVSDNIFIYRPGRGGNEADILGVPEVCEKFGINNVSQVIDILGMMGDAVDNIPGIPGIGEKTATKLVQEFGSLEGLLANTDKLKGKQKENVENNTDIALLSKKLATIILDVPVEWEEQRLLVKDFDKDKIREVFEELEFRALLKRVLGEAPAAEKSVQGELFFVETEASEKKPATSFKTILDVAHSYLLVQDEAQIAHLIEKLQSAPVFCFDTETTEIEPINASLVGLSFAINPHEAYYVPVRSLSLAEGPADVDEAKKLLARFAPVFSDASKELVAQNYKYDYKMLRKYGIDVQCKIFDTMIAHYLMNPDGKHGMDELSENYLQYSPISIETLIGKKGKTQGSMADLAPEAVCDYAAEDADITLQLKNR
ncbi:MAG: 5'-3' exonuclease H3TH domain-containing protein, partial [Flavobacteriales bacterium]